MEKIPIGHKCAFCGSHNLHNVTGTVDDDPYDVIIECGDCKRIVRFPDLAIIYLEMD